MDQNFPDTLPFGPKSVTPIPSSLLQFQHHGCVFLIEPAEQCVVGESANASDMLDYDASALGRGLEDILPGSVIEQLRPLCVSPGEVELPPGRFPGFLQTPCHVTSSQQGRFLALSFEPVGGADSAIAVNRVDTLRWLSEIVKLIRTPDAGNAWVQPLLVRVKQFLGADSVALLQIDSRDRAWLLGEECSEGLRPLCQEDMTEPDEREHSNDLLRAGFPCAVRDAEAEPVALLTEEPLQLDCIGTVPLALPSAQSPGIVRSFGARSAFTWPLHVGGNFLGRPVRAPLPADASGSGGPPMV